MELSIDPASEQTIISLLRSGNLRQAARLMVRHHGLAVYRICRAAVGQAELAEDLTQAAFARAFALLSVFQGEISTRAWVERIAHQCCSGLARDQGAPAQGADGDTDPTVSESLRRRLEVLAAAL